MAMGDISRNSQTRTHEVPFDVSAEEGQWSKWYSVKSMEDIKSCIAPAMKADDEIRRAIGGMELTDNERELLKDVKSLQDFLGIASKLEGSHRQRKGAHNIQQSVTNFQEFANTYSHVVDALADAPPFGAGHLVWGVCAIALTAVANKTRREQMISKSLARISKSLPRLDAYRELYPTDRMILLIAQLYANNIEFLCEVFTYYKNLTWKGSAARLFVSNSFNRIVDPLMTEIDKISREIIDEGTVGLSAEVRTTRLVTQKIECKVKESAAEISDLRIKFNDSEEHECRVEVSRMKHMLVPKTYDPSAIYDVASRQARALGRDSVQIEACQSLLDGYPFTGWGPRSSRFGIGLRSNACECKDMIWVTGMDRDDLTVSYIAHDAIESLKGFRPSKERPLTILHSLHQSELPCNNAAENGRTASGIVKEAIYQLLYLNPRILRSNNSLKALSRGEKSEKMDTQELGSILCDLLRQAEQQLPVFWVIDRVDNCRFRGGDGAWRLSKLVRLLHEVVESQKGALRVLLTSIYEPHRLDDGWHDGAEEVLKSENWVQCQYTTYERVLIRDILVFKNAQCYNTKIAGATGGITLCLKGRELDVDFWILGH